MIKKIQFGSSDAFVTDNDTKTKVIDYLYSKLDLSKHRYNILNNIQKLKFLQESPHYVSPNYKGYNYLLIMMTINNKQVCAAIDRKKLSYHKSQLDLKTIQVIQINMLLSNDSIFRGSIFDGKLIQNNNTYIFLLQDCFSLMGSKLLDMEMNDKMKHLDNILKTHFMKDKTQCSNFEFKLNKLYCYDELEKLISDMPKLPISTNGIIFYPKQSGITVLHIEKKLEKIEINSNNNEVIEQKSYNIIKDFVNFLKSRTYSYEANSKMKHLWLNRTIIPDVYDISEKENGDKMGIALVPNLKTSHMCDDIIKENPVKFNCVYSNKFKKWIPLNTI